jgi:hypothetical protein
MSRRRQLGVALDHELRERLETLAEQGERSIADEIRQRIERTLEQDALAPLVAAAQKSGRTIADEIKSRLERTVAEDSDPVTRELVVGILNLVEAIRADLGVWHEQTPAHHAFAAAVAQLLADYRPLTPLTGAVADLFGRPEELEATGRTLGRHDQRSHNYEHLKARQQQRARARAAAGARRAKKEGEQS